MTRISTIAAVAAIGMFLALGRAQAGSKNSGQRSASGHSTNSSSKHRGDGHHNDNRHNDNRRSDNRHGDNHCGKNENDSCSHHHHGGMSGDDSWNTIHPIPYQPTPPQTPIRKFPVVTPVVFKQPTKISPVIARNIGRTPIKAFGNQQMGQIPTLSDGWPGLLGQDLDNAIENKISTYETAGRDAVQAAESIGTGVEEVADDVYSTVSGWL